MGRTVCLAVTLLLLTRPYGLEAATPDQEAHPRPTLGAVQRVAVQPTAENAHFKGIITKVLPGPVLMVNDEQTRSVHFLELTPATSLKAKKKADFGGRKNLDFEDLAVGQRIKVTYEIATNETLKIKVLDQATLPH
jgi:hypothetical protein